jgi:hypothetical protein
MPEISREVIEHKLDIDPAFKPIKQKERRYTPERCETIRVQVNKLLEAGFIWAVDYPSWLANPVLIEKLDGSWHMCIDYTSLNKACVFVRSWIPRQPVNSCRFWMHIRAIIKSVSPQRMKNGGATFQKCVRIVLKNHIGRNVEAYIDDIVMKSKRYGDLLVDLKEAFDNLRKYKMMLNPKNMCLMCHQENCLATWYCPGG